MPDGIGRFGLCVTPQQLGAELFADDLSRRRVVALERRDEDALEILAAFEAADRRHAGEAHGLALVTRSLLEDSAPPGLRRRRAEQPRIRLHEVRAVDWIEPFRRREQCRHLLGCGGTQNRLVLQDPIERRDQQAPIGGWSHTQCARQRGDGAAPRRLDDERARRATACEVGALETLAEPPQRGRVEERGERLRCPGGAIGAGHREQQRGVLPPEQAREQQPQACDRQTDPADPGWRPQRQNGDHDQVARDGTHPLGRPVDQGGHRRP